jgi:nitrogen-specific signal transduction histidine kinase
MIKARPVRRPNHRAYMPLPLGAPFLPVISEVIIKKPALSTEALAHEIRNPLTNINLAVEMLKDVVKDESQRLYLEVILRASHKVNKLVNELIMQQKPEKAQVIHYSMHQLLDEVLLMRPTGSS